MKLSRQIQLESSVCCVQRVWYLQHYGLNFNFRQITRGNSISLYCFGGLLDSPEQWPSRKFFVPSTEAFVRQQMALDGKMKFLNCVHTLCCTRIIWFPMAFFKNNVICSSLFPTLPCCLSSLQIQASLFSPFLASLICILLFLSWELISHGHFSLFMLFFLSDSRLYVYIWIFGDRNHRSEKECRIFPSVTGLP